MAESTGAKCVGTASGSAEVQIAESVVGRRRAVRQVDSARAEVELGVLMTHRAGAASESDLSPADCGHSNVKISPHFRP